jgi:ATP-dependent Clp endopeptidase proteolytic subunit ClpP
MMHVPFRTTRPVNLLEQGRLGWYRIANQAVGPAQVTIYDEIGFLGVSADSFMRDLSGVDGDIEMHINSPGGDVFDGIAIYNQLRQRPGVVSVVVDGLAASAASFIAQAASPGRLAMAPHSQMMIHDGFGMSIGNAADMRQMADLLDKASDNIAAIYADRTGRPAAHWRELMRNETWLSDSEAVAHGLADHVLGQERPQNTWDLSVYDNRPRNDGKYSQDDRDQMAGNGHAMPDGSYPIEDAEDLSNAIHAVGRGGADHDSIRAHIIKRANASGPQHNPGAIPDNWNSDGSLKSGSADNLSAAEILALFNGESVQLAAGKE